jgi:hypothetical protein
MSYDVYLTVDLGGPERVLVGLLDWNYTSNVSGMWRKAMPETDGLRGMDGMLAGDALKVLERGIAAMEADPEPYRAMNPENGWGSFAGQLARLRVLADAFRNAPKATVGVSA